MRAIGAADAVALLNRIHGADPSVLPALIGFRVPCNRTVVDDPTVQVGGSEDNRMVGILGIINGLFGVDGRGRGFIGARYDEDGLLVGFEVTT